MPSILPDFEYDIFISYRQNDNKSASSDKRDGWVTSFVQVLRDELEATLKNPISRRNGFSRRVLWTGSHSTISQAIGILNRGTMAPFGMTVVFLICHPEVDQLEVGHYSEST